ncbi:putative beta-glucan synthesis-associated protein [Neolecta irregularis DAH-3]|uniref:Putative beta-glucan synthesis-associated protein n=1 Tax=Neolecta irregularis (strain DAH-3) TaxID=1198029 RepID=A0A1U7LVY8_NEOID|nr:putative beta-glucan synthesis-associated protein [Neolecta irregularis DAH-3]|eukprot:OLL26788.1 putative beta-glucan synthesis-associated protein [Neolecta irregularis DAH-3]
MPVQRSNSFPTIPTNPPSILCLDSSKEKILLGSSVISPQSENPFLSPKDAPQSRQIFPQQSLPHSSASNTTSSFTSPLNIFQSFSQQKRSSSISYYWFPSTQTITKKFTIIPHAGLLSDPKDAEPDDAMHNPSVDKISQECNIWTQRGFVNTGGLLLIASGLIIMFVVYPIFSITAKPIHPACDSRWDCVSNAPEYSTLKGFRRNLVDPDTPTSAWTKTAHDGSKYKLVFSDEFNQNGRTFYPGEDQFWEAVDLWYWPTQDLQWYDPDAITTKDGFLQIQLDAFKNHNLSYRSGMLQSWNKFCFKGGIIEASISLPGSGNVSGLWPGFWTMGNLGRPGYGATNEGMWPYSYQECDTGITPNQSRSDGLNLLPGMRLPSCTCSEQDHPSPGKGRSAPEIDVVEASVDPTLLLGTVSQSNQIAPFDDYYMPNYDYCAVYNPNLTMINKYRGSHFQQAMSGQTLLNNDWYDGKAYQSYGFEYQPGKNGFIEWFIGDYKTWMMTADSIGPNGNIGQRTITEEPMSIIFNLGLSNSFSYIDWENLGGSATMRINWIRIYQDSQVTTCDPEGWPTSEYISNHLEAYMNANWTTWEAAGYTRPKNSLMDGCH